VVIVRVIGVRVIGVKGIGVRVKSVRVICVRVPDQGGACDAMEPATANSFTLQNINWLQNALLVGTYFVPN
jgi:hypothetical protein